MADEHDNPQSESERRYEPEQPIAFRRSEIAAMSPAEYQKNRAEIFRSQAAGVIVDDITTLKENIEQQTAKARGEQ